MSTTPLFLDSWKEGSTGTTSQTGLSHLEGLSVYAMVDSAIQGPFTVASGAVTLSTMGSSAVYVGLSYDSEFKTQRIEHPDVLKKGTLQGRKKKITRVLARTEDTGGFQIGRDSTNLDTVYASTGSTDGITSRDVEWVHSGGFASDPYVYIKSNAGVPLTLLALIMEVESGDR